MCAKLNNYYIQSPMAGIVSECICLGKFFFKIILTRMKGWSMSNGDFSVRYKCHNTFWFDLIFLKCVNVSNISALL